MPAWTRKAAALGWAALVVALCLVPGPAMPDAAVFSYDKVGHFGMFFVGALLAGRAWPGRPRGVLLAGLLLAAGTEVLQVSLTVGRAAEPLDAAADAAGLLAGLGLLVAVRRRRARA